MDVVTSSSEEKLDLELLDAVFRTSKKTIQEYVREIERYCRFRSIRPKDAKNGFVVDDRSKLIDLYEACVQQDAHLVGTLETLKSQIIGERYMLCHQNEKGKYVRDNEETKKIQGTEFTKLIWGIVEAQLYGYTGFEIMPDVCPLTGRLAQVNQVERRNIYPSQRRICQRSGCWVPGWSFDDEQYRDNYILIDTGGIGLFAATTPSILAKKFTMANYVNFSHTYGQPIIHGKAAADNNNDRKRLANDIASAATNKVIVTGLDDEIDIKTFTMSNSEHIFTGLIAMVDRDVSNLILGSESMAGATQSYVGATRAHQDIFRDRVEAYRDSIENVMNEQIIPRLVKMGFLKPGNEFKYCKQIEMSDEDQIKLYEFITERYEVSADEIEKNFGIVVGRQLNVMDGVGGGSVGGPTSPNDHHIMSDEEYYRRYGHRRGEKAVNFFKGEALTGANELSRAVAQKVPEISDEDKEKEYLAILAIFERFLDERDGMEEPWEVMEELMAIRADFAIHHAIHGFGMEWDDAIQLIQSNLESLSELDRARADIIIAAINNLAEFAVAEEYQMMSEADDVAEEAGEQELDEDELRELLIGVCKTYNSQYAHVENLDIEYAMMIADALVVIPADRELMYMTQGDERVRPWHLQYEGFTAPKSRFPEWLIPPIEHQCRCYLVEVDDANFKLDKVQNAALKIPSMPDWFNPTFKESVALGGRIFSDEHPYFQVNTNDSGRLAEIVQRIKEKYMNG